MSDQGRGLTCLAFALALVIAFAAASIRWPAQLGIDKPRTMAQPLKAAPKPLPPAKDRP